MGVASEDDDSPSVHITEGPGVHVTGAGWRGAWCLGPSGTVEGVASASVLRSRTGRKEANMMHAVEVEPALE